MDEVATDGDHGRMSETPKETAYDTHIAPLMTQIIALCQEHSINAFATFALDECDDGGPLLCTTALPVDPSDMEGEHIVDKLRRVVRPEPLFAALMVSSGGGK